MSKQVEVGGVEVFSVDACATCGALPGHERYSTCVECRLVTVPKKAILVSDLPAICKHFSDRLLSNEAVEAACRSSIPDWREDYTEHTPEGEAAWDEVKDALRAALQAASLLE